MKSFATKMYHSLQWKKCRKAYLQTVHGLCERCLKQGIYRPADIVHHKIFLTEKTVNDPEICYSFEHLEAVCRQHHEEIHNNAQFLPRGRNRRYDVLEDGTVITRPDQ